MSETIRAVPSDAAMSQLVDDVATIVGEGGDEQVVTERVAAALSRALNGALRLPTSVAVPDPHRYLMYPLHVAPDGSFSIASAVWNVGQETPIHDHGVWGVVGIYSGVERELRYLAPAATQGGGPLELLEDADWHPGDVTVCCTTDQDVHKVICASDVPCVGIHVYGGDIGSIRRRSYHPLTGEVTYFRSAWAQPSST